MEDKKLNKSTQQAIFAESVQIPVGSADVREMIAQKLYADKVYIQPYDYFTSKSSKNAPLEKVTIRKRSLQMNRKTVSFQAPKGGGFCFSICKVWFQELFPSALDLSR